MNRVKCDGCKQLQPRSKYSGNFQKSVICEDCLYSNGLRRHEPEDRKMVDIEKAFLLRGAA